MVLLLLFPIALLGAALLLLLSRHRTGTWSAVGGGPLLLFLTLLASYALAFAAVSADPYYENNGAAEFIELRYRWAWAALFGGLFSLVGVPAAFALRAVWLWWWERGRERAAGDLGDGAGIQDRDARRDLPPHRESVGDKT